MAEPFSYRATEPLSTEAVVALAARLPAAFPGFEATPPEKVVAISLSGPKVPDLAGITGFDLTEISLSGETPSPGPEVFPTFVEILRRGAPAVGQSGLLEVSIAFEQRDSRQSARYPDTVAVSIRQGVTWWGYSSNASRFGQDVAYARALLERAIPELGLPLELRVEGANYFLDHAWGGQIWLSNTRGLAKQSPGSFRFEWQEASPEELVEAMRGFLAIASAGKWFASAWRVATAPGGGGSQAAKELLALAGGLAPAKKHSLEGALRLRELAALEAVRRLCRPKDEVVTPLGSLDLPEEDWLNVVLVTTAKGHLVELQSRSELAVGEWGGRLGLTLGERG